MSFKVACIQLNSTDDLTNSTNNACKWIDIAAKNGAELIVTPENTPLIARYSDSSNIFSYNDENHPALLEFKQKARKNGIWLIIGSIMIKLNNQDKFINRSYVINPQGEVTGTYDKIHLFDAELSNGKRYKESDYYLAGKKLSLVDLPWGKIGLTICYDLRFPYLYRTLALLGASFITVPSAFTDFTGQDHWHVLLRSRAIENSCYIFAPDQTGESFNGKRFYGHSLIVDPWGKIIAEAGIEEGYIMADIDINYILEVRKSMAVLKHDKQQLFFKR